MAPQRRSKPSHKVSPKPAARRAVTSVRRPMASSSKPKRAPAPAKKAHKAPVAKVAPKKSGATKSLAKPVAKKPVAQKPAATKPAAAPAPVAKTSNSYRQAPVHVAQPFPVTTRFSPKPVVTGPPPRLVLPPPVEPANPVPVAPKPLIRRALVSLTVVTRKSPLAIAQADLVMARLNDRLPEYAFRLLKIVTTGDRQEEWSLERQGGMGLFTGELEGALRDMRADIAVHSAKDLPTENSPGLSIAGYLPREDPHDVLVVRDGLARPATIATSSPRRRLQMQRQFPKADFLEIRGNVDTRLRKIAEGLADSTVLASAGLKRLGISEWPGLRFQVLPLAVSVPAVGQGAIAVQARGATADALRPHLDEVTSRAVELERCFLRLMGGGCHTAFAVHYDGAAVHIFHETCGYQRFAVLPLEAAEPGRVAERLLAQLKLRG